MMPKLPPARALKKILKPQRWGEPGRAYYSAAIEMLTEEMIDYTAPGTIIDITSVKLELFRFLRSRHEP